MQDYRLRRLQHHIRATEVARLLNITRQAVEQFEACERHHRGTRKKYEEALALLIRQRLARVPNVIRVAREEA